MSTERDPAVRTQQAPGPSGREPSRRGGLYRSFQRLKSPGSRIRGGSRLYTLVMPAVILILGLLTVGLIVFAAGVLLGIVPFR